MNDQEAEIERLRALLGKANKTIRNLERHATQYGKLAVAAQEVIKWVEWSGSNYILGSQPINDLRTALQGIRKSK